MNIMNVSETWHKVVFMIKRLKSMNKKRKSKCFRVYPKAGRLTESTGAPLSPGLDMLVVGRPCSM